MQWPMAAISREALCHDAGTATWLRADPAFLRADLSDVRLVAYGPALAVRQDEAATLARALMPLFGDAGFTFDWPCNGTDASRAWVRMPADAPHPVLSEPAAALGDDLLSHLPAGRDGARWRSLFNDVQVVLHQHSVNAERLRRGQAPVNGLWLWGGGRLPHALHSRAACLHTDDPDWRALQQCAGGRGASLPTAWPGTVGEGEAFDLRGLQDAEACIARWLSPACTALSNGTCAAIDLLFDDGAGLALRRGQRWRVWRRPWRHCCEGR